MVEHVRKFVFSLILIFLSLALIATVFPPPQRHFWEAEIYLLRLEQCMMRAMTLIKMYL
jgi:hypothetical protein